MADPIDKRAFEAMEYAVPDLTAVDISMGEEGLSAEDLLTSFGMASYGKKQKKALHSFNRFIGLLPSLSKFETSKLEELWIKGGKPFIKIHSKGEKGFGKTDPNRAYFRSKSILGDEKKHVDMMGIFKPTLLEDFMAEISHSMKYALKEGESKESWIKRREKIEERVSEEKKTYGASRYGIMFNVMEKSFPTGIDYGPMYSIDTLGGKEVVVDEYGNTYPEMEVPPFKDEVTDEEGVKSVQSRVMKWQRPEMKFAIFDPETRLGSGGERLTEEFEAHKVVEDSLWGIWEDILKQVYGEEF